MKPTTRKSIQEVQPEDYVVEKTIFGPASRATNMKI